MRIRELEDDILLRLTESSGDVTEDRALVEGLEESKKLSKGITQKLAEMKVRAYPVEGFVGVLGRPPLPRACTTLQL